MAPRSGSARTSSSSTPTRAISLFRRSRDITDRKRAELALASLQHRTETILNSAAEGIYGIDREGVCTIVNAAAARLTGYSLDQLLGSKIHDLVQHTRADGSPYPGSECKAMLAMERGEPIEASDEVYWRKDGTSFPVEYSVVPIREGAVIIGAVLSFRDITDRRAIERMKDEFVSIVSHELRTPLTSIRGSLGLLRPACSDRSPSAPRAWSRSR